MRKPIYRSLLLVTLMASLAACAANPLSGVFGKRDQKAKAAAEKNIPEKANRISVLALENTLSPDEALVGKEIVLPPAYINAAWTQPGGDADHTMHHLSANLTLQPVWSTKIGAKSGKRAPLLAPPVIADGRVFVIDPKAVVSAYDSVTGSRIWETALTPDVREATGRRYFRRYNKLNPAEIGYGGGVAFDNGRVFITSGFGFVAALEAETGTLIWQEETPAPVRSAPTAVDGKVYTVTNTNEFIAFNQETGKQEWKYLSFEESARFLAATSPAANKDVVVAPFSSGEITLLNASNGRALWSQTVARSSRLTALSNLNDIAGSPIIDRGTVYAISHAGQMSAIDLRSGKVRWEAGVSGLQTPWLAGEYIFVVSVDGELVCLSKETGGVAWIQQLPRYEKAKKKQNRITWTGPIIAGGRLVLTSSRGEIILASPQNGEILERRNLGKKRGSIITPVIANEQLFILSEKGQLTAYR